MAKNPFFAVEKSINQRLLPKKSNNYFKHILKALKTGLKKRKDDFGYEYHTFVDEIFK